MSQLRKLRMLRGGKACDMARKAGISPPTWSLIENRRLVPKPATRARIAEVFEVPEGRLFRADGLAKD